MTFQAAIAERSKLGDALDEVQYFDPEFIFDTLGAYSGVFDCVMQESCCDRARVHAGFRKIVRHFGRMDKVVVAGIPLLIFVGLFRELVCFGDE